MKFACLVFAFLVGSSAFAESVTSTIYSIEESDGHEKDHLLFLTSGHVVFIDKTQKSSLENLRRSLENGDTLQIERDARNKMISVKTVYPLNDERSEDLSLMSVEPEKQLFQDASSIFAGMRRGWQNQSQCYNRAHIWTYEAARKGVNMMKIFLFFTKKYIYRVNYGWWFHVTPMLENGGHWLMMDRRYTKGPMGLHAWTNLFVYSHRTCPTIYRYTQYSNHQYEQDCYVAPTTKFFWQPYDILNYERTGRQKTRFIGNEVNWAYKEAF